MAFKSRIMTLSLGDTDRGTLLSFQHGRAFHEKKGISIKSSVNITIGNGRYKIHLMLAELE